MLINERGFFPSGVPGGSTDQMSFGLVKVVHGADPTRSRDGCGRRFPTTSRCLPAARRCDREIASLGLRHQLRPDFPLGRLRGRHRRDGDCLSSARPARCPACCRNTRRCGPWAIPNRYLGRRRAAAGDGLLALVGFVPGVVFSQIMYAVTSGGRGHPDSLHRGQLSRLVLGLSLLMCIDFRPAGHAQDLRGRSGGSCSDMLQRTPLAWKNLTYDRRRLAIAVGGVGFAVLLMFIELGFLNALLDSTVQVLRLLRGDLIIVSRTNLRWRPASGLMFAASIRLEVRRVSRQSIRVYMETMGAVLRRRDGPATARLSHPRAGIPCRRTPSGTCRRSKRHRGPFAHAGGGDGRSGEPRQYGCRSDRSTGAITNAELAGKRVHFVGTFYLGVDFANDGNVHHDGGQLRRLFSLSRAGSRSAERRGSGHGAVGSRRRSATQVRGHARAASAR